MSYEVEYEYEKETPGTYRYQTDFNGRKESFYVTKGRFGKRKTPPKTIKVTVEWTGR